MKLHPAISAALALTVPPVRIMLLIVVLAMAAALGGCASLTQAGNSGTKLTTVQNKDGKPVGCDLELADGKEYASREVSLTTINGAGCELTVKETGVKAFRGQGIAAKALSFFPVTGLDDLLGK
jgi:hypothetical protein